VHFVARCLRRDTPFPEKNVVAKCTGDHDGHKGRYKRIISKN